MPKIYLSFFFFFFSFFSFFLLCSFCSSGIAGECVVDDKHCIEGAEERFVDGFWITRKCWRWRLGYKCSGYAKNNCELYKEDTTCEPVNVEDSCIARAGKDDKWCVANKRKFQCDKAEQYIRTEKRYKLPSFKQDDFNTNPKLHCNEKLRCIDGKCFDASYAVNDEFGQVSGMLAALQKMKAKGSNAEDIRIFIGNGNKCSKKAFGLNDCCKPGVEFVEKVKLSICDEGEKELRNLINENRCHYLGSYKDKFGPVKKATNYVYCCYDDELAKEVQVQGRRQLGRGFGTPKAPECGGFSVKDLQKIEFSKIDFSFVTQKIQDKAKWGKNGKEKLGSMRAAAERAQEDVVREFGFIERLNEESQAQNVNKSEQEKEKTYKNKKGKDYDRVKQPKPEGRDISRDESGI